MALKERRASELGEHKDIMNEAKLLSSLDHPNILKCIGNFLEKSTGLFYIILEWAHGGKFVLSNEFMKLYSVIISHVCWSLNEI